MHGGLTGELDGVRGEVHENLLEPMAIRPHGQARISAMPLNGDSLGHRLRRNKLAHVPEHGVNRDVSQMNRDVPRLDLGKVQDVGINPVECFRAPLSGRTMRNSDSYIRFARTAPSTTAS